jgi:hypothetical protein
MLSENEQMEYLAIHTQKEQEKIKLLESFGFLSGWNEVEFGDRRFEDLLKAIQNKFALQVLIFPKLTKKEIEEIQAFTIYPTSILPTKHDLGYGELNPYSSLTEYLQDDEYKISVNRKCGILGTYRWKDNYFKATESSSVPLIITEHIRSIIERNGLQGIFLNPLENFNRKTNSSTPIDGVYCATPKSLMKTSFVYTKLTVKQHNIYEDKSKCIYFTQTGSFVYKNGALQDMQDCMFINPATQCESSDMIVSKKFREVYIANRLKGLRFEPVFELDTALFDTYNQSIVKLSKMLMQYNHKHSLGHENIELDSLVDGII